MKKTDSLKIIGIVALLFFFAGCTNANSASGNAKIKFASTNAAQYSHLISGDSLDAAAQAAISGFNLSKQLNPDGTTTIMLKALSAEYSDQSYNLKSGEQLYFIEKYPGDDANSKEANMGDDSAVIVDADGYVVK